jgi:PTH1 family peptidyl-tRNA hydrolase
LRFGIGNDYSKGRQSDFVLGEWSEKEQLLLSERLDQSIKFIQSFASIGLNMTMTALNGK